MSSFQHQHIIISYIPLFVLQLGHKVYNWATHAAKMSVVMNKVVMIHFKAVMIQFLTFLFVELDTTIAKSKGSIEAYPSIS